MAKALSQTSHIVNLPRNPETHPDSNLGILSGICPGFIPEFRHLPENFYRFQAKYFQRFFPKFFLYWRGLVHKFWQEHSQEFPQAALLVFFFFNVFFPLSWILPRNISDMFLGKSSFFRCLHTFFLEYFKSFLWEPSIEFFSELLRFALRYFANIHSGTLPQIFPEFFQVFLFKLF